MDESCRIGDLAWCAYMHCIFVITVARLSYVAARSAYCFDEHGVDDSFFWPSTASFIMAQTASSSSTTSTSTPTSPTILTHLHSLLALQTIPSLPYLHPYAPSKGKAKADDLSISGQLELLGQLKRGVLDAKSALERASGKDEKVKLARAMKEV